MAMDMARLDNTHCVLRALSDSSCPEVSSSDFAGDPSAAAVVSLAVVSAAATGEQSEDTTGEFLNFVTESDVLDFDCKLPDEVSGVEGDELLDSVSFDDDSTKSLQNLELRELRELLQEDAGNNSVNNNHNEVGEEEAQLLAKARDATVSDSGECSSGPNRTNPKCKIAATTTTGGAATAAAAATTTTTTTTKKKAKVDWTPELHRRFVHAVEQLGVEKAFPSRILELMGVQCLTRHNIASHLQKYRSHRRHLAAREAEAASWTHRRTYHSAQAPWPRTTAATARAAYLVPLPQHIQPRPLQPAPLKVWGYPTVDHSNVHMWQQPAVASPPFWQAPDGSYWQHPAAAPAVSYDGFYASHPMRSAPVVAPGFPDYYGDEPLYLCNELYDSDIGRAAGVAACSKPAETPLSKEVLDAAIGEALANPWTPPPLGLKPPSMEGVIAELQRQGINTVPPSTC